MKRKTNLSQKLKGGGIKCLLNKKIKPQRRKIKVNFVDFWENFNYETFSIYKTLTKFYDVEISPEPDFLFYSCFASEHKNYGCVKIFVTGENVVPNFNWCDYAIGFDYIEFEDRYLQYNILYRDMPRALNEKLSKKRLKELCDRKFCNFLYRNTLNGEGAKIRQEFFEKLSKYKRIDAPSSSCHNLDRKVDNKLEFLAEYKFTIAFENSSSNGYTTEKLGDAFYTRTIPIYWGNPRIGEEINSKSFINCNDYNNDLDKVIEKIIELDNDDKKYIKMLKEKSLNKNSYLRGKIAQKNLDNFLINIIEKGNVPFKKDPLEYSYN